MDRQVPAGCTLVESFRVADEQALVKCAEFLVAGDRSTPRQLKKARMAVTTSTGALRCGQWPTESRITKLLFGI